jgi:hypothetical protein
MKKLKLALSKSTNNMYDMKYTKVFGKKMNLKLYTYIYG